jgi:hypothetical protein
MQRVLKVIVAVRAALVWLLLALETVATLPVFAVSWFVSAIGLAVVGGYRFAKIDSNADKRAVLGAILGGKVEK